MKLSDYLAKRNIPLPVFARTVDVSLETIRRYISGDRMPHYTILEKIRQATGGLVDANDFHAHRLQKSEEDAKKNEACN